MEYTDYIRVNTTDMASEKVDWEGLEPIPQKYAYSGMLLVIVFFQIVNKIVGGKSGPKGEQTDFWKWKNLYISWIHAVVCSVWDIGCMVAYPELFQDLIAYHNMHLYGLVCFTTGYFVYDFMDITLNQQAGKQWEVLVHHVAVGGVFLYTLCVCRCVGYTAVALTVEINTVFLHSRKLLQMAQVSYQHWLYRLNMLLNFVSFVLFRFGALIVIMYGMYMWRARVSTAYYVTLTASMFVMCVINCVLFWRLLKSDVLRPQQKPKPKAQQVAANGHLNNNHPKQH